MSFQKLNMELSQRIVIESENVAWIDSPANGVRRKPLEREGKESGHVSSIVEYLPGSRFAQHNHPLGEEIWVLEGVFSDEHGDYPKGSYLRNPPGSSHSPFSINGCVIFVKLNQMDPRDLSSIAVNSEQLAWQAGIGGLRVKSLHQFEHEHVALVKWPAGEVFSPHRHFGGEEILVLSGKFEDEHGEYPQGTWIRSPHYSQHHPFVREETVIWVKTGHLAIA
ncbi:cupin [Alginatibacterium sediminis]|uniref:Cupin n=1 Tax=Alginatibacterium sediminis TaxID=2164068 RepID=A0A420E6H0_9ALTE|nr:cupin domain-containing protein [Alginatibacterium sediminis]RKF13296.1 cupin [Alginatibacterium sediminis]